MGEGWIFLENHRASLFNEELLNEPNFGGIQSRWTVPLKAELDEHKHKEY
jgi:hypothetical protein